MVKQVTTCLGFLASNIKQQSMRKPNFVKIQKAECRQTAFEINVHIKNNFHQTESPACLEHETMKECDIIKSQAS